MFVSCTLWRVGWTQVGGGGGARQVRALCPVCPQREQGIVIFLNTHVCCVSFFVLEIWRYKFSNLNFWCKVTWKYKISNYFLSWNFFALEIWRYKFSNLNFWCKVWSTARTEVRRYLGTCNPLKLLERIKFQIISCRGKSLRTAASHYGGWLHSKW